MDRLFFGKSQRISSKEDFGKVFAHRCVVRRGSLRLYAAPNDLEKARFGVSVSRTCGGAVERNRLKRIAREVFRKNQHQVAQGVDYIVVFASDKQARGKTKSASKLVGMNYHDVEIALLKMMHSIANRFE